MDSPPITTRFPQPLYKAAVDTSAWSVTACLTYPQIDLAGDWVEPTGGDWSLHAAHPAVNLEHYRYLKGSTTEIGLPGRAGVSNRPVVCGWARESLERPDAPHAVEYKSVRLPDGKDYDLPFGTTYFDRDDPISAQTFALIQRDALPGVSLEFQASPDYPPTVLKAKSPLENRPAWHFDRWDALTWAHCEQPVNSGALTLTKSLDALRSILSVGKIGSEPVHPILTKALAAYAPTPNRSTVVSPGFVGKAMTDDDETENQSDMTGEDSIYDDAAEKEGVAGDEPTATPTAQAAYDLAQILTDACAHVRDSLKQGEHVSGRKAIAALCDKLEMLAEKATATGDKITADVAKGGGDFDADDDPELEEDATEPDEDDDGVMKAFRAAHRRVYRKSVKRFRLADLQPASALVKDKDGVVSVPAEPVTSPEDKAYLEKALRQFQRAQRLYG